MPARRRTSRRVRPNSRRSSRRLRANSAFTGENYDIIGEKVLQEIRNLQYLSGMAAADSKKYLARSYDVHNAWLANDFAYLRDLGVISAKDYEGLMSWDGAS